MRRRVALLAGGLLLAVTAAAAGAGGNAPAAQPADAAGATLPQQVAAAAAAAQARCHGRIHHDTFAYERCLLELLAGEPRPTPKRLGIEYFGYVGAMNSARMGMAGAEDTAYLFLSRFQRTQKRLRIDDRTLCSTVPGDCDVRIARMRLMAAAPEARQRRPRDASAEEQHVH